MKNIILILLSIIVCFKTANAQNNLTETEKLVATAKIWGFLKYYHPNVANGKLDWDNQLLVTLPSIEKTSTTEELSGIYINWIESLGGIKLCKKCQTSPKSVSFDKNFDLAWFENNKVFTKGLTEKLRFIEQNRYQGKPHYVTTEGRTSSLVISNEKSYGNFDWKNRPLRLLSLFRYWNTIEYFYPHKYQLDTEWDVTLSQMLPKFSSPVSELAYHLAMLELVVKIDDSHGYFTTDILSDHFGLKQIPAAFRIIDDQVIITGLYDNALANLNDIKVGDVIRKVEEVEVTEVVKQNLKYSNGSNYEAKLKHATVKILNGSSDSVNVEITRGAETKNRKLARYTFDRFNYGTNQKPWEVLQNNIGYIKLGIINEKELVDALSNLISAKAIIIDLRGYPKEFYGYHFRDFLGVKNAVTNKVVKPDFTFPGKYILSNHNIAPNGDPKFKGEVLVLVDEYTQSRAEYTAMWLQNGYHVRTVGSQTAGAGGVMIPQEFVGGYKSYFTSSAIFYPDMGPIQRSGVKIDIEVKPTIQGIIAGNDEVLEQAIELVIKNK